MAIRQFVMLGSVVLALSACATRTSRPTAATGDDAGDVIVTGSRADGADVGYSKPREPKRSDVAPPAAPAPAPPVSVAAESASPVELEGGPPVVGSDSKVMRAVRLRDGSEDRRPIARQSGTLTAGDHDDLLNPQLYARYAANYLQSHAQPDLPLLDAAQRIRIVVRDGAGRAAPFVRVAIKRANAAPLVLTTAADGAISVFPALDGLPTRLELSLTPPGGQRLMRSATPVDRIIAIDLPGSAKRVGKFDLLLTVDTTGSMGDELGYLQVELKSIVARLKERNPGIDIRVGLLAYRDIGDDYVTRPFALTSDIAALQSALAAQSANGGGDYPEAVDQALAESVARFEWRADAVKAMLFVADAPPHSNRMAQSWAAAMAARAAGIHIVPVGASGVADDAEYLMRSMAALTQSRYVFLTDDSGVGLPHQDPNVPCYLVTRLDNLVGRVLGGLIAGARAEPRDEDVIRRVGDYDKGLCLPSRSPRPLPRPVPPRPDPRPY
jgi:hypothetical protein